MNSANRISRAWAVLFLLTPFDDAGRTFAQNDKPPVLISLITMNPVRTVWGEVKREGESQFEVLNLMTGELQTFAKVDLKTTRKGVSEQSAIEAVGLSNYMAWKIKKVLPLAATGKIAQIDGSIAYLSLGLDAGVDKGSELTVYRGDTEIKDPDTGAVLGKQRRKIARLKAISVEDKLTKAELLGDLEIKLEIGDVVEPADVNNLVAVFPLVNADESETVGTKRIAEELTTGLVRRSVRVVERRLLDKVRGELGLQQGIAFDPARAQPIGKQLGAYGVVVGTVSRKNKFLEAQLRLVKVETGEILVTASQVIRDTKGFADPVTGATGGKWTSLFVGKELTQWNATPVILRHWTLKGDVLRFDGSGKDEMSLATKRTFRNFVLRCEWRIESGGDSGIYLRGTPQVQIWDHTRGNGANIGSGGLHNNTTLPNKPQLLADRAIGEWNSMIVSMRGDKVTVELNGVTVVDGIRMENWPDHKRALPPDGPIVLQAFGSPVEFRNLSVQVLAD